MARNHILVDYKTKIIIFKKTKHLCTYVHMYHNPVKVSFLFPSTQLSFYLRLYADKKRQYQLGELAFKKQGIPLFFFN